MRIPLASETISFKENVEASVSCTVQTVQETKGRVRFPSTSKSVFKIEDFACGHSKLVFFFCLCSNHRVIVAMSQIGHHALRVTSGTLGETLTEVRFQDIVEVTEEFYSCNTLCTTEEGLFFTNNVFNLFALYFLEMFLV
jgi:hypothetical protein